MSSIISTQLVLSSFPSFDWSESDWSQGSTWTRQVSSLSSTLANDQQLLVISGINEEQGNNVSWSIWSFQKFYRQHTRTPRTPGSSAEKCPPPVGREEARTVGQNRIRNKFRSWNCNRTKFIGDFGFRVPAFSVCVNVTNVD